MPFSKLFKSRRADGPPEPAPWGLPEPAVPVTRRELEAQLPCSPRDIHDGLLAGKEYSRAFVLARKVYMPRADESFHAGEAKAALRALSLYDLTLVTMYYPAYAAPFLDFVSEEMKSRRIPLELRRWLHGLSD